MEFYEKVISRARGWSLACAIMFSLIALLGVFSYQDASSLFSVLMYGAMSVVLFLYWINLGKARQHDDIQYLEKAAQMQSVYLIIMGVMMTLMFVMIVLAMFIPLLMK